MSIARIIVTLFLMLFCTCLPFRQLSDVERIEREAKELYKDIKKLLPESLTEAAKLGRQSVVLSFGKADAPEVIRFIARTSATTLTHEAVEYLVKQKARKIDKIFGTNHTDAVVHILLHTYCYPVLDDIITAEIDRRFAEMASESAKAAPPALDSVIAYHLQQFDIDLAKEIIRGFTTREMTPEYYRAVGMSPINTATYAATRNWKDHGITYQFRIKDDVLSVKRSDEKWKELSLPQGKVPKMLAADNNRCLVLTDDNELWWYCIKRDQAQWSIDIMRTVVAFTALKPVVGDEVCSSVIPAVAEVTDSVTSIAATSNAFADWKTYSGKSSKAYWSGSCSAWTDIALSVDRLLLKTGDGSSFTAADYAEWSKMSHAEGTWSNLLSWTSGDQTFHRGINVPNDSITDIAVGNWNGTVVTDYIVAQGKIWFLDEEIIQPEWKPIEKWNAKWAILENEYHPIGNAPYPLDSACRIDASNSVIAVWKESSIYWLRWDYHQKDDFVYWPLDWCEHSWYKVNCPSPADNHFRIVTTGTIDPHENNTVWSIPAPAFTIHNYLPMEGYQGIFGDVPREKVSTYPVDLFIKDAADTIRHFSLPQAEKMGEQPVKWTAVTP